MSKEKKAEKMMEEMTLRAKTQGKVASSADIRKRELTKHINVRYASYDIWSSFIVFLCTVCQKQECPGFSRGLSQSSRHHFHKYYMDDYLNSVETEEEAIQLVNDIIMVNKAECFELRIWLRNYSNVLKNSM